MQVRGGGGGGGAVSLSEMVNSPFLQYWSSKRTEIKSEKTLILKCYYN